MTSSHVVAIFQQPTDVVIAALNSDMSVTANTVPMNLMLNRRSLPGGRSSRSFKTSSSSYS